MKPASSAPTNRKAWSPPGAHRKRGPSPPLRRSPGQSKALVAPCKALNLTLSAQALTAWNCNTRHHLDPLRHGSPYLCFYAPSFTGSSISPMPSESTQPWLVDRNNPVRTQAFGSARPPTRLSRSVHTDPVFYEMRANLLGFFDCPAGGFVLKRSLLDGRFASPPCNGPVGWSKAFNRAIVFLGLASCGTPL